MNDKIKSLVRTGYNFVTLYRRNTNRPHYPSLCPMGQLLNYLLQDSLLFQIHRLHLSDILSVVVKFLLDFAKRDLEI